MEKKKNIWELLGLRYKSHPWHGVSIGTDAPNIVTAFIEIVPTDTVKYEVDKKSGFLKVDRPQKFSNIIPALYGFIPQTYCDTLVGEFCSEKSGKQNIKGDDDPLDICVLTERHITHGDLLVKAIPIGGFRMIDGGEADDKIIAVMKGDQVYEAWDDISKVPTSIVNRLKHYFLTYKNLPGAEAKCEITHTYGKEEALEVIKRSQEDYRNKYGDIESQLEKLLLNEVI
jgi:inorganic pyrophosphatase